MLDLEAIKDILPHRYPFLMIDRVLEIKTGKYCKALKNITTNESLFQGHFPQQAVFPGVLMVEAMAQTAGIVIHSSKKRWMRKVYFSLRVSTMLNSGLRLFLETN